MNKRKIELLSPAGDMERLRMAVAYGADAVYLAGGRFGMRAFAGNFTQEELAQAVTLCHNNGVAVHVTCNTMPRNEEAADIPAFMEYLDSIGVDAVIVADLGVFEAARQYAPHVKRHMSTQAGVTNYAAARVWHEMGAHRVILARELCLEEIAEIRAKVPAELELEAFAHGAMCVSYSGRCVLSNYMTGRDASRGACAQPCRYSYALMEEKRPGEFFPVMEDDKGTYIFNSRDMCMLPHLPDLLAAGVDSVKIEGRAKSAYYTAAVTNAYRHGIDAALRGEPLDPVWLAEVDKTSHRPFSTGFFYGYPGQYTGDSRYVRDWQVVAVVDTCDSDGNAVLSLRNKITRGEELELIGPGTLPVSFAMGEMEDLDGYPLPEARVPQMKFKAKLPCGVKPLSILRAQRENS